MNSIVSKETLSGELSLTIVRLARCLRGRRASKLVSLTQLSALSTLHQEGPMTPGALAAAERVQPPSMTRIIASLADLGMIRREPHPTDGRQAIVTLAESGTEVVTAEHDAREEWLSTQLDEFTPEERATLTAALPLMNRIICAGGQHGR